MKTETIKQIILTADKGMYLTNGETYGRTVILPETARIDDWREITEEEYKFIVEEETATEAEGD